MANPYVTAFERLRVPDEIPVEGEPEEEIEDLSDDDLEDEPEDLEKAEDGDPCWDGYEQVGMKQKNGREVPNCVPLSKSLFSLGGALYYPALVNGEFVLAKASRRPSPGQMSLFDISSPRQGERKTINGTTYVLNQNSRWEREDDASPAPVSVLPILEDDSMADVPSVGDRQDISIDSLESGPPGADIAMEDFESESDRPEQIGIFEIPAGVASEGQKAVIQKMSQDAIARGLGSESLQFSFLIDGDMTVYTPDKDAFLLITPSGEPKKGWDGNIIRRKGNPNELYRDYLVGEIGDRVRSDREQRYATAREEFQKNYSHFKTNEGSYDIANGYYINKFDSAALQYKVQDNQLLAWRDGQWKPVTNSWRKPKFAVIDDIARYSRNYNFEPLKLGDDRQDLSIDSLESGSPAADVAMEDFESDRPPSPDDLMQEGFRKVEEKFAALGEEPNDYTRIVYGLAEVMNANGDSVQPMDLSNRWHDPLASIPAGTPFERIKAAIEGTYERDSKIALTRTQYQSTSAYSDYTASQEVYRAIGNAEQEGRADLEAALRKEGIRRNTKRWKDLYAKNEQRYIDNARENAKLRADNQIKKFERDRAKDAPEIERLQRSATHSDRIVRDLETLGARPELIDRAKQISQWNHEQASRLATRYDGLIQHLQTFVDTGEMSLGI